jgi:transposase
MEATVTMSKKELERAEVVALVCQKRMTQRVAAEQLGISERQLRRIQKVYERDGASGLCSKRRGRPSNRRLSPELRDSALSLVRERYHDFGPTLASEKLKELHGLTVSVETLRSLMIDEGLWVPHRRRGERIQQPRRRRDCFGELIQIDGCDHHWFEERAARCTLLVFIDDATGRLTQLYFAESESTFAYFNALAGHLRAHGKPTAFYSDKAGVFRVNAREPAGGDGLTQFGRALGELNIDIICANTPAAKGRVERANLTLQDRLVKELRLRGIASIEAANAYAEEFVEDFNRRFGRVPRSSRDAHRPLLAHEELRDICQWRETRKVSKQLTLNYQRTLYVLEPSETAREARGKRVDVYEDEDGKIEIRRGAVVLPAQAFQKEPRVASGAVVENKLLGAALQHIRQEQARREEERLRSARLSRREKRLLEKKLRQQAPESTPIAAE